MRSVKHITNTWLLTVFSFPWIYILYFAAVYRTAPPVEAVPFMFLFSLLISSGGYVLCLFFFQPIRLLDIATGWKFLIWIIVMEACIVLGTYLVFAIFFDFSLFVTAKEFLVIACVTAAMVALIRFEHFEAASDNNSITE
jgi:hypothetical protein